MFAFLLNVITKKFDRETLLGHELSIDPVLFQEIYLLSLYISDCISYGRSSGSSNYTVMIPDNSLPMVYLSRKRVFDPAPHCIKECQERCSFIDATVCKESLTNFLGIDAINLSELPLDYGVIFTGIAYMSDEIESTKEQTQKKNDRLDHFIATALASLSVKDEAYTVLSELLSFDKNEAYDKNIDNTNLNILEGFNYLLKHPHDEVAVGSFIDIMKNIGLTSFSYQRENKLYFAIEYLFYQYRQFEDEEIGIIPFNTGKIGGSLFFVMRHKRSRITLQKVLEHLHHDNHIALLDYASWRDGYSSDGVYLEQYITEKIYSCYTSE